MGCEVTTKGDIYSYGILLEMLTGKRPTDDVFDEDMNLHKFAKGAIPDRALEILDPTLVQEMEEEEEAEGIDNRQKSVVLECLISILEIGVNCCLELPTQRMQTSEIVAQLQVVKKRLSDNMAGKV